MVRRLTRLAVFVVTAVAAVAIRVVASRFDRRDAANTEMESW